MKHHHRTLTWIGLDTRVILVALIVTVGVLVAVPADAVPLSCGDAITSDTTLTADVLNCPGTGLNVVNDDVTLDCAGHTVSGMGIGDGIAVDGRTGVTVKNCTVTGFEYGITLGGSDSNTVSGCTVTASVKEGILLFEATNNTISRNVSTGNGLAGFWVGESSGNEFIDNEARGNNDGMMVWKSDLNKIVNFTGVDSTYTGIVLAGSDRNEIIGSTTGGGRTGIFVGGTEDEPAVYNTVRGSVASNNSWNGFLVQYAQYNTFASNRADDNDLFGFDDDAVVGANAYSKNHCTGNKSGGSEPSGLCQEEPVGLVNPASGEWHLRHSPGQVRSFYYGNPGDVPFMGDWDCSGTDTPGLYRQSDGFAYLRNSNSQGIADIRFFFGNPSDIPLAGDFNGDGCDTLSIYRPSEARFYIINQLGADGGGLGAADYSFLFGDAGDKPVVGDWDGDGIDEIGLHRETTGFFYYRNTLTTGIADGQLFFGDPGDRFVSGDWGVVDGVDTPAMFRPSNSTFYFRHTLTQGIADSQFVWTGAGMTWLPVSGDFTLD